VKAAGHSFEVIFVSSDRSAGDFKSYFGTMPWLAIPNGDTRKEKLSAHFEVEGIPSFVVLDAKSGAVVNGNARGAVGGDPEGASFPWSPPPIGDMSGGVDGINDEPCVCLMLEGAPKEERSALLQALTPVAEASKAAGDGIHFFVAHDADGPAPQIRALTQLGEPAGAQAVLLDIPDDGGFYAFSGALSADALAGFVKAYKDKTLPRKQLSK
jgi:nucleoredoxin